MTQSLSINPLASALLLMDFQGFVLNNFLAPTAAAEVVSGAAKLLDAARANNMLTIHVTVDFRPGYPEISPRNKLFSYLKDNGVVVPGSEGMKIHPSLTPRDNEPVVVKHRIGAFNGTDLDLLLRARGIETLIVAGVTTSGVVLSTVRQAFDLDYDVVVVTDACTDPDEQAHALLIEKILSGQATMTLTEDIEKVLQR